MVGLTGSRMRHALRPSISNAFSEAARSGGAEAAARLELQLLQDAEGDRDHAHERGDLARIQRDRNGNVRSRMPKVMQSLFRLLKQLLRRMFPRFELNIKGLDPEGMYSIVLCMKLVEPVR